MLKQKYMLFLTADPILKSNKNVYDGHNKTIILSEHIRQVDHNI